MSELSEIANPPGMYCSRYDASMSAEQRTVGDVLSVGDVGRFMDAYNSRVISAVGNPFQSIRSMMLQPSRS